MTSQGQKTTFLCANGTETWMPLKDLKEPNVVEVAEFAKVAGADHEPTFCWHVPHLLRKIDVIVSIIAYVSWKIIHEHGIGTSADVEHVKKLDAKNSNNFQIKSIENRCIAQ